MIDRFKTLLWVSRPVSWVNTAYPFGAAYVVLTDVISWPIFILGSLFFLIPYNLLMYGINDVFDYESDLRNPRKGGIEGALAAPTNHKLILRASIGLSIPFIIYLLTLGDLAAKAWFVFLIFMVVAYSAPALRFKERPILDSFTSATHFAGPMVYAFLLIGFPAGAWPAIIAFYAWGMASHAFGAIQDIQADRAGKIASIATVFGAQRTLWIVVTLYAVAAEAVTHYGLPGTIVGIALLPYLINAAQFYRVTDEIAESVNRGWRRFIWLNFFAGFIVTLVLIQFKLSYLP